VSKRVRFALNLIIIIGLSNLIGACDQISGNSPIKAQSEGIFTVNKTYREFYRRLGGVETLGPAITNSFPWNDQECQYTENALMCFNSLAKSTERFTLFPLGANFNHLTSKISQSSEPISIYKEFLPFYKQLGEEQTVGKPITNVRFNPLEQRLEQYFENLGLYRLVDDPSGEVQLLAYGVYACAENCSYTPRKGSAVSNQPLTVDMPFLPTIAKMDNPAAFGEPLTIPYQLESGQIQQVYENAVFIGNSANVETVRLLDVPVRLGYQIAKPGPQTMDTSDGIVFYNVQGANGFHVPIVFDNFIIGHGGREFSGNPIGEYFQVGEFIRQCFENYCLDYYPDESEGKRVRLAALGEDYLKIANLPEEYVIRFKFTPETVALNVNELYKHVPGDQAQEILISAWRRQDSQPIPDVDFTITLTLPDGTQQEYNSQPTNLKGESLFSFPTYTTVKRGRIIAYQVCLNQASADKMCIDGQYLIW
jgi:hypothetical protein